ncbi:ATPase involved in DNA repair [Enhygromyxa salina]|uniref:ATPase involved in DNA repair n=1 Tax=Enhygromyxa salina TaxID=215803 RepID=A0A0C2D7I7_9BACT|nr:hypothetical protein [Enhygromyxa salina]KIG17585.1 ATPase involved in DNA repair [Enhygromyxa salina]
MSFRNYACWKVDDATAMLRTEALESSRAVFMAVHSPIRDFQVEGVLAGLLDERSETGLLDALTRPDHRHLFCVVQGEPGSGKSHLIRWLRFCWEKQRKQDLVLMVPRSNGSLEGALRHMKERLPDRYQHLFAGLGQVQNTTLQGRARDFHSKLANSLSPNYFSGEAPEHAEWAEKNQLSRLIGHHQVIEQWSAPRRILETLSGGSERNSRVESFTLRDVHELALLLRSVRDRTIGPKALQARRKFELESAQLGPLLDQNLDGSVDAAAALAVAPMLVRLREALDARFNAVVQDLVGVGRDGLVRAFRQLRKHLAKSGQRLVLLLEDITSFQGVDKQLLDVLVAKSETEEHGGELCDLLSVVGITTDFFDQSMRSYGNLRERVSLHVYLGDATAGQAAQSLSLTDSSGRQRFAIHYLRAVRAGIDTIERWEQSGHGKPTNACVACPHRGPCHRAFGSEDGVGFYPLSPRAIDRIFESLRDPAGTMSLRTPRGMVQNVLSPLLLHPERLERGEYPPANLEGTYLPKDEGYLLGQVERIPAMLDDPADSERMRRFIAWWSSRDPGAQTRRDAQGRLLFAEIAKEAYEAFDLCWPGEPVETEGEEPDTPALIAFESNESARADEVPEADAAPVPSPPALPKSPRAKDDKGTSAPHKVSRTQMDKLRTELKGWFEGGRVSDDKKWSLLLMEVLNTLPWRSLDVPHWLQHRLFTDSTVMLEGSRKASVRHFVIPRVDWVREGLDGWLALRTQSGGEVEYHRKRVARFLRRLNGLVLAHVESKSLAASEGGVWNPAGTAAQALLARAWLQGRLPEDASLAKRWEMILVEDQGAALSAANHTPGWQEVIRKVGHYLGVFRQFVRDWVQLSLTPEKGDDGIVDAGAIAPALVAFGQRLAPDLPPLEPVLPKQLTEWVSIADVGRTVRKIMPLLAHHEFNRVKKDIELLEFACDRRSLPQYFVEVGQTIEQLRAMDNRAPQARIEEWHRVRRLLTDKNMLEPSEGSGLRKLDDFLGDTDPDAREALEKADPIDQLAWILKSPYDNLVLMASQVEIVQAILVQLWSYVSTLLQESPGDDSDAPGALDAAGTRLGCAAEQLTRVLTSEGKS